MPSEVKWYQQDTVIAVKLYGNVSAEDIAFIADEMSHMIESSDRILVHALIDVGEIDAMPRNIGVITKATRIIGQNKRLGWVIHYGTDDRMFRSLSSIVNQIFKTRYRLVGSKEIAVELLQDRDPALPPLQPDYEPFVN